MTTTRDARITAGLERVRQQLLIVEIEEQQGGA